MKKATLRWLVLAAVLVLAIVGCDLLGVSVQDRVSLFLADLNSTDRSDIYLNFHPALTVDYSALQGGAFPDWSTLFPTGGNIPYSINNLDTADPGNVTGDFVSINGVWLTHPFVFRMAQDGPDWMIQEMDFNGSNIIK